MATYHSLPGPRYSALLQPPVLLGQTVVVLDAVSGIGLATTRRAKVQGARLIITGRDAGRLEDVADEIGVDATAAFDPRDVTLLEAFLVGIPTPVDHVVLCMPALQPVRLAVDDFIQVREPFDRLLLPLCVAWFAVREMTQGGSLLFIAGTNIQLPRGDVVSAVATDALSALVARLAPEITSVRVNLITPAALDQPESVAAVAIRLMSDDAVTGATCKVS